MLVLTRKSDEELLIDGHIRVRVLSVDQGRVRLGIVAPRSVPVSRSELLERPPAPPRGTPSVRAGRPTEAEHASLAIVQVGIQCRSEFNATELQREAGAFFVSCR